jgi:hypothetical protein
VNVAVGDDWLIEQAADWAFYAVDNPLPFAVILRRDPTGRHARRERVEVGPALPVSTSKIGGGQPPQR